METITYTQDGTTYELPTELVRLIRQDHRHRGTRSKHRTVNFTRTAFPFCLPGSHFGMLFTTRTASLSR